MRKSGKLGSQRQGTRDPVAANQGSSQTSPSKLGERDRVEPAQIVR
jgi:hypothetical protein